MIRMCSMMCRAQMYSCIKNVPVLILPGRSQSTTNPSEQSPPKGESKRMAEFRKKLREKTPIEDLGDQAIYQPPEDDPLPPFPNNTNPLTGEVGGPRGPEPTRYGDWERKGRCTDF